MTPLPRFVPVSHPGALSGRVPKGGGRVVTGPAGGQAGFADTLGPSCLPGGQRGPKRCRVGGGQTNTGPSYSMGAGAPLMMDQQAFLWGSGLQGAGATTHVPGGQSLSGSPEPLLRGC